MNYGLVHKQDAVACARAVCDVIGHGKNNKAVELLVETAAAETLLGDFKDPTPNGAGTGLTQVDFETFEWLRTKYMGTAISSRLMSTFGFDLSKTVYQQLRFSPLVSMIFCRLRYHTVPTMIPDTRAGRAEYWKRHYNTSAGKGTPADYLDKCRRSDVDSLFEEDRRQAA
ncbi:hypothetical protein H2Y56_22065 [Pectobacterium aroidearum]|uniref:Uncharacterized protein n=1 Tax=Pectobacterium aroidearum TaxID=1201031 RepID=A0ABR5ZJU0_9GAMM|nr:hypothetical protein [Pectobacterium aroidearum]MBA5234770.1 hypothetical protein [Pectobacterium aroidearum]MBA5739949.1 hypothetical protein [Pectobacterium aroidearum]